MDEERFELTVDRHLCGSSGMCVAQASNLFSLQGGYAMPTGEAANLADALLVQQTCPTEAISIRPLDQ